MLALSLWANGCAKNTEVELRLYPCPLMGEIPVRVELDILGRDAQGAAMPPLRGSYPLLPEVLEDGYATLGLSKPAGMVEAEFVLTWHGEDSGVEVVQLGLLPLPAAGEALKLGAEMCAPVDAMDTSSGSSGETTTTGDTSTSSSSSGEPDTSSTSSSGDDTTTTGTSTSSTGTTDGTSTTATTGEPSMVGDDCNLQNGTLFCEGGEPSQLGTLLLCMDGKWKLANLAQVCVPFEFYCPAALGLNNPVLVGCSGVNDVDISCVCRDEEPQPCDGSLVGCDEQNITLCVEIDGSEPTHVRGLCATHCEDDGTGPICEPVE